MSSSASSRTSNGSSPRGQVAKNCSERLEDNDQDRGDENQHRKLVETAQPDVAAGIVIGGEVAQQPAAPEVVAREQCAKRHLRVQPAARAAEPAEPKPD